MAWVQKVRRHVVYLEQKTVGGNTAYVKRRPAQITAIASNGDPVIKISNTSTTLGNASVGVPRKTHSNGNNQVSRFVSW